FILGIKRAWLIGLGIAVLDLLPVFGTGTVLIPWAVIKLFSGDWAVALGMLVIYVIALVVHQMLQPKLVGDAIGLNVFATLVYMYIGYKVQGVIGMMIAVPIGMVLESFYKAGAFDRLIWCVKELGRGIAAFCHIDKDVIRRDK
ncbi:MAG: AI-2E family transporter, partial [Peptococcaceae bacterium]|nr:AI-2E family transporter [Peptococcaceae bacterium]